MSKKSEKENKANAKSLCSKIDNLWSEDLEIRRRAYKKFFFLTIISSFILTSFVSLLLSFSPLSRKFQKRYIMNHPEDIIESFQNFEEKQKEKVEKEGEENLIEVKKAILADSSLVVLGNKNSSNVIIEFFDYSCSYCKKGALEVKKLLSSGVDFKLILIDTPVLSPASAIAARAGIYVANNHPDKLSSFHFKLIQEPKMDEDTILQVAKSLGIPTGKLKEVLTSSVYDETIKRNYVWFNELRGRGTPLFIVNDSLIKGSVPSDMLKSKLS